MPIKKSAKKALRQSKKHRARNLLYQNKLRILIKRVKKLVSQKQINEAKKLLPKIYKSLDKAGKIGIIKFGTASRKKSRITKLVNKK